MVNNAGISLEALSLASQPGGLRIHETPMSTFDLTMSINTRGVFLGCKYAIAQFLKQPPLATNSRGDNVRGWIVNMGSVGSLVGLGGAPSYTASKHAVLGLTKQIATDYGKDKIHCNAICPGCEFDLASKLVSHVPSFASHLILHSCRYANVVARFCKT